MILHIHLQIAHLQKWGDSFASKLFLGRHSCTVKIMARALHNYAPRNGGGMGFWKGEVFVLCSPKAQGGWWLACDTQAEFQGRRCGFVPDSYIEVDRLVNCNMLGYADIPEFK